MYEIVMAYNTADQAEAEAAGVCRAPVVFMNRDGGYAVFAEYAESIDRGDEWVPWSEDESCPQRDVQDDTEAEHRRTAYCENPERGSTTPSDPVAPAPEENDPEEPAPTTADDVYEPNDTPQGAIDLTAPVSISAILCPDDEDWFSFELVDVNALQLIFAVDQGDIDVLILDAQGEEVASGESTDDDEEVDLSQLSRGQYTVQVYHYQNTGECQPYELSIH